MSKCYSVAYDLDKPGQDYQKVWDYLRKLGAARIEDSLWLLWSYSSAFEIAQDLLRSGTIDSNDRLMVSEVTSNCAWYNLMLTDDAMKKSIPAA